MPQQNPFWLGNFWVPNPGMVASTSCFFRVVSRMGTSYWVVPKEIHVKILLDNQHDPLRARKCFVAMLFLLVCSKLGDVSEWKGNFEALIHTQGSVEKRLVLKRVSNWKRQPNAASLLDNSIELRWCDMGFVVKQSYNSQLHRFRFPSH